ncbi:hypothetical protein M409DRAFT_55459 [Zasmidium cellare ATCC 36951]|uniref:Uncharacterized protein n=1 Tax=Zasmidium cellare ATCC 36951 TaxID=1080233 RepID=A0A6A6CGC8_ZASCE|nr:uncharacterized protein M409DRAFT_55459 [Zasmidium cellare ATCC 36951]KAF2166121.1 hypothetical protein M409DRAFT_55459 [Zasmidium cellare ATCC 36951]
MSVDTKATQGESVPLRPLLEKLPQELYDCIYDLTFTTQPGIRYTSKPPKGASEEGRIARPLYIAPDNVGLLHVDRHSRDKFARSYYGGEGAVFVYDVTRIPVKWPGIWWTWGLSLSTMHRSLIKDLRYVFVAMCEVEDLGASYRVSVMNGSRHLRDEGKAKLGLAPNATVQFGNEGEITDDLGSFRSYAVFGVEQTPIRDGILYYDHRMHELPL